MLRILEHLYSVDIFNSSGTKLVDSKIQDLHERILSHIIDQKGHYDAIVVKEGSTSSFLVEADGFVANFNVGSSAFTAYDNEAGVSGPYAAMGAASGEARITAGSTASDDVPLVFRTSDGGTNDRDGSLGSETVIIRRAIERARSTSRWTRRAPVIDDRLALEVALEVAQVVQLVSSSPSRARPVP